MELANWVGERKISKAEDLLIDISDLLKRSGVEKSEVTNIIYSQGAGSRTGIRVGAATAKGLKLAFGGVCQGETVLKALALKTSKEKYFQTSVQISQTDICRQIFERKRTDAFEMKSLPQIISNEEFLSEIAKFEVVIFLPYKPENSLSEKNVLTIKSSENIARLLAIASITEFF